MCIVLQYEVESLPDAGDPLLCVMAGGDVAGAVSDSCAQLLRSLVTYAPGSARLTIRYLFTPSASAATRQSRLTIALIASAQDDAVADNLRVLVECSDLATLYGLHINDSPGYLSGTYRAGCDIARVERAVQPLHAQTSNRQKRVKPYSLEAAQSIVDEVRRTVSSSVYHSRASLPTNIEDLRTFIRAAGEVIHSCREQMDILQARHAELHGEAAKKELASAFAELRTNREKHARMRFKMQQALSQAHQDRSCTLGDPRCAQVEGNDGGSASDL